ncbi:MAG: hypothetical protein L3J62_03490 [Gammaproteobacteria bacterium]|nr:hypothetical protein [Gammaproteobacteria bacterium]MCF6229851.1 hypothetical protein [Gammaproteobacteria bacterium]
MQIFIGNIPKTRSSYELHQFIKEIFKKRRSAFKFWMRSPDYLSFNVIDKTVDGDIYRYAIAHIEPSAIASESIELLDQQFFGGNPLDVREYRSRSYMNERRAIDWREQSWSGAERRSDERRKAG